MISQLRSQAAEIAAEGHRGWGNTMLWAADALAARQQASAATQSAFDAGLKAAAEIVLSMHSEIHNEETDALEIAAAIRSRIGQQKEDQEVGNE